jgi:vitamin K-dependent gamma-carboxylase
VNRQSTCARLLPFRSVVLDRFASAALAPVDAASLIAFRVGFGLLLAAWCIDDLRTGRAQHLFEEARFHFTYFLFDFLRPWPGAGMRMHLAGLLFLALSIAAGFKYRATTILFALGFSYFFLLDRTNYQNHYYLLMLVSWALTILPLNRCFALDAVDGPRSETVPAWCLWLVRFHVALPYVFGGMAKLDGDWLAGEPMRTHLASKAAMPVIGPLLTSDVAVDVLSWGGLAFDLGIVPLLLWPRSRVLAYLLCIAFHLTNALLFDIHVFPWFMLVATTVFFSPGWPRRLLRLPTAQLPLTVGRTWAGLPRAVSFPAVLLACYCTAQVLIPLRPFVYGGDSAWTERGHHFSWRMMLRTKTSGLRYYVVDKATGRCGVPDIYQFVREDQSQTFSRDPEMILHFAHFLAERYQEATGREASVHALVLTSLNGRKPQLLIDPNVDLAAEPRGFVRRRWIMPLKEPLRRQAWQVPLSEWERSVELPPLTFLRPPPTHLSASPPGRTATRTP